MFSRHLAQQGHTRQFVIRTVEDGGWEVREEADRRVVWEARYDDWHRVERARTVFSMRVSSLEAAGWTVIDDDRAGPAEPLVRAHGGHSTNR